MLTQLLPYYISENSYADWIEKVNELDEETKKSTLWLGGTLLLESNNQIELAEIILKEAVEMGYQLLRAERDWRDPLDLTDTEVLHFREIFYSLTLDTYGQSLQKNKKSIEAKDIYRKAAIVYGKCEKAEINQHYIESLLNLGMMDSARIEARQFQTLFQTTPFITRFLSDGEVSSIKPRKNMNKGYSLINENFTFFELKDENGEVLTKEKLLGKVVVVDFWASWCKSCILGFEGMYNLTQRFKSEKDVVFLFVNTYESIDPKKASEIVDKMNYGFKILFDEDEIAVSKLKVSGLPTKLVIDKKGRIRYKQFGEALEQQEILESVIEQVKSL